jgi:hypothetical protein
LVGNSKSLTITLSRGGLKLSALASAFRPADAEAVTAISSGCARSTWAMPVRTASFFMTHTSQFAPTSSRSSM